MADNPLQLTSDRTVPAPAALSTGRIWADHVVDGIGPSRVRVVKAYSEPGARTAWHLHERGQILLVTDGLLVVQERGSAARLVGPGQSHACTPGVWHWHGAGPDHLMVCLAIVERDDDGHEAQWGDLVTDEEYAQALARGTSSPGPVG